MKYTIQLLQVEGFAILHLSPFPSIAWQVDELLKGVKEFNSRIAKCYIFDGLHLSPTVIQVAKETVHDEPVEDYIMRCYKTIQHKLFNPFAPLTLFFKVSSAFSMKFKLGSKDLRVTFVECVRFKFVQGRMESLPMKTNPEFCCM